MNENKTDAPGAGLQMAAEFIIGDLETLRLVADPIRVRILELLVLEPQPVKRLAATLELPQTKLYYHINLLEERGLIQVVGTRVVSGIIEKQYGAVARSYRVDEELLKVGPEQGATVDLVMSSLLDGVRNDLRQSVLAGRVELKEDAPAERKITIGRALMRLSGERAEELHQRLNALVEEYCDDARAENQPADAQLYQLFVAFFPTHRAEEGGEER